MPNHRIHPEPTEDREISLRGEWNVIGHVTGICQAVLVSPIAVQTQDEARWALIR